MTQPNKLITDKEKTMLTKMVQATIAQIDELVELMALEMDLVNNRKLADHAELLKKKQRLTVDYRANIKSLAAQADMLKQLPEKHRNALKASAQKMAEMADRNSKFLRTAVIATQRLIQNIVSIVKQEVLPKAGYNNPHTQHLELGTYSPTCQPVAVNRTA